MQCHQKQNQIAIIALVVHPFLTLVVLPLTITLNIYFTYFPFSRSLFSNLLSVFVSLFMRMNQDLFERQAFEDDGVYDWDLLKKQQEQGTHLYHSNHVYIHETPYTHP